MILDILKERDWRIYRHSKPDFDCDRTAPVLIAHSEMDSESISESISEESNWFDQFDYLFMSTMAGDSTLGWITGKAGKFLKLELFN